MSSDAPIIGRERILIDLLTDIIRKGIYHHELTPVRPNQRGNSFEVRILSDGGSTGRIAKVTVELERVESS